MTDNYKISVNVEQIMSEILKKAHPSGVIDETTHECKTDLPREDARSSGRIENDAVQIDIPEFMDALDYANAHYDVPYYFELGHRGLKTFVKRVVRKLCKCIIPVILAMQNAFNASIVACLNQIRYAIFYNRREGELHRQKLDELDKAISWQGERLLEIAELRAALEQQRDLVLSVEEANQALRIALEQQGESIQKMVDERILAINDALAERQKVDEERFNRLDIIQQEHGKWFERQEGINHDLEARLLWREKDDEQIRTQIEYLAKEDDEISSNMSKMILKRLGDSGPQASIPKASETLAAASNDEGTVYTKLDYFKFQNHFRGTRMLISQRQKLYLPYFEHQKGMILDLGCGRGEFLSLMKENNIPAFGIDLYPEYVIEGELNGLDIRQGNGIEFLSNTDQRFGGIFCAHVIEHISFTDLQALCFAAYEKLEDGAYLVLETPNPTCLSIYAGAFYIDPTHQKPLSPLLVEYVLHEAGFRETQVIFSEASRAGDPLPQIDGDGIRNLEQVNQAISKVSNLLYGAQDYAVVAKK